MKKTKKLFLYLLVLIGVILIIILFMKIFKFNKKTNIEYPEVTESEINELYSLFSESKFSSFPSFYLGNYISSNNINFSTVAQITYDYINRKNPFKFETITKKDLDLTQNKYKLLSKIDKNYFLETAKYIFEETNAYDIDLPVDETKSIKIRDSYDYIYVYESENTYNDNIVYYKGLDSYTVENGNESIKLIEYFLWCDKATTLCYDNVRIGTNDVTESSIRYSENLNVKENIDKIKKYEHKFSYKNDHYEYVSSRQL